ncbi:MAG: site-specific DNA-methyltransferase [Planctomycetaceae bacterium]|nr:site-specific DNA-methyltransferase [Planctomycetaceae bacterium]
MLARNDFHCDLDWPKKLGISKFKPAYSTPLGAMLLEDSLKVLKVIPSSSVDLVMTSPPFALTRQKEYGNEPIERYLEWFTPFCLEIKRILKSTGSFVLDIGGAWIPGVPVRSVYHFELAVRLAKEFSLAQEFYWYNPSRLPTPAEWVTVRRVRVKDAVNMIWWFSKTEWPKADNRCILQPYSESMKHLIKHGYKAKRRPSGHDISTKFQKDNGGAIPPNLITIANTESNSMYLRECKKRGFKAHPARYPESRPMENATKTSVFQSRAIRHSRIAPIRHPKALRQPHRSRFRKLGKYHSVRQQPNARHEWECDTTGPMEREFRIHRSPHTCCPRLHCRIHRGGCAGCFHASPETTYQFVPS